MILHRPLKRHIVNQKFGENRACINDARQVITCDGNNPPEGYRSVYGKDGHLGIDLHADTNEPVYCAQNGTVYAIDPNRWSGLDVRIQSNVNGRQIRHIYEHLNAIHVREGDEIKTGDVVGLAGSTGFSSATHLHFQVEERIGSEWRKIDPDSVLSELCALDVKNVFLRTLERVAEALDTIQRWIRTKKK